jgi:hypothetical protein
MFGFAGKVGSKLTDQGKKMAGQPLVFFAWLVAAKGDWKFEKEFFDQLRSWASKLICTGCGASKDELDPFGDRCLKYKAELLILV